MKKKTLLVLITTTVLGLMPAPAKADCVRTCEGKLWAHFSYKPDEPGDIVRSTTDMVYVPGSELSRDGRSGSCSGAVGRQRARIRACEEVIRSLWANYANKLPAIKQAICEGGDATPEYLRLAQWIVVDRAEARAVAYATSSGHSRYAAGDKDNSAHRQGIGPRAKNQIQLQDRCTAAAANTGLDAPSGHGSPGRRLPQQ